MQKFHAEAPVLCFASHACLWRLDSLPLMKLLIVVRQTSRYCQCVGIDWEHLFTHAVMSACVVYFDFRLHLFDFILE